MAEETTDYPIICIAPVDDAQDELFVAPQDSSRPCPPLIEAPRDDHQHPKRSQVQPVTDHTVPQEENRAACQQGANNKQVLVRPSKQDKHKSSRSHPIAHDHAYSRAAKNSKRQNYSGSYWENSASCNSDTLIRDISNNDTSVRGHSTVGNQGNIAPQNPRILNHNVPVHQIILSGERNAKNAGRDTAFSIGDKTDDSNGTNNRNLDVINTEDFEMLNTTKLGPGNTENRDLLSTAKLVTATHTDMVDTSNVDMLNTAKPDALYTSNLGMVKTEDLDEIDGNLGLEANCGSLEAVEVGIDEALNDIMTMEDDDNINADTLKINSKSDTTHMQNDKSFLLLSAKRSFVDSSSVTSSSVKTSSMNTSVKTPNLKTTPVKPISIKTTPVNAVSIKTTHVNAVSIKTTPVNAVSIKTTLVKPISIKTTPVKPISIKTTPVNGVSIKTTPVKPTSFKTTPVKPISFKTTPVKPISIKALSVNRNPSSLKTSFVDLTQDTENEALKQATTSKEICKLVSNHSANPRDNAKSTIGLGYPQCGVCMKYFGNRKGLEDHMGDHKASGGTWIREKSSQVKLTTQVNKSSQEKKISECQLECPEQDDHYYECGLCAKTFSTKPALAMHRETHFRKQAYACNLCDKTFAVKSSLDKHRWTHTEKPYKCKVCELSFVLPDTLGKHRAVHVGGKKVITCKPYLAQNLPLAKRIVKGEAEVEISERAMLEKKLETLRREIEGNMKAQKQMLADEANMMVSKALSVDNDPTKVDNASCAIGQVPAKQLTKSADQEDYVKTANNSNLASCSNGQVNRTTKWDSKKVHVKEEKTVSTNLASTPNNPVHHGFNRVSTGYGTIAQMDQTLKCYLCGHQFETNRQLVGHITRLHFGHKPYPCIYKNCGKSFPNKGHLENHVRIHTGEKPFKCETCGKSFRQISQLYTHQRAHSGEKPHTCHICGKAFARKDHFRNHIQTHSGFQHQCHLCNRTYVRKDRLSKHIKEHHNKQHGPRKRTRQDYILQRHKMNRRKALFRCKTCQKSFTQKVTLQHHNMAHSGEKPYKCTVCGKKFVQKVHLNQHSRIHTGVKSYCCNICGKRFLQSSGLYSHRRKHNPYECKVCGKSFARRWFRDQHLLTHDDANACEEDPKEDDSDDCDDRDSEENQCKVKEEKPYQCTECGESFAVKSIMQYHVRTQHQ